MKKILLPILGILGLAACSNSETTPLQTITIIAPNGAPALSQVEIAHNAQAEDFTIGNYKVSFETTNGAQGIQAAITAKSHDIIVAPINLGVKLYNSNQTYKYLANITDGNLYLAATFNFTLADLATANLVFFGEGTINQAVVDKVLAANNISRTDITYLSATSDTNAQLVADKNPNTIYLVAEPALSTAKAKLTEQGKTVYTLDVQEEFYEATNGMTFLQAGVFVKADLDKNFVQAYLEALEASIDFVNEDATTASTYATDLGITGITPASIPGSNLHFRLASDCKDSLNALVNLNPTLFGGSVNSELYY